MVCSQVRRQTSTSIYVISCRRGTERSKRCKLDKVNMNIRVEKETLDNLFPEKKNLSCSYHNFKIYTAQAKEIKYSTVLFTFSCLV